jgi:hypothetical protein
VGEIRWCEVQQTLKTIQNPTAAGMEEKAVEILKGQMLAQEKAAERGGEPFLQQAGQLGTEDNP